MDPLQGASGRLGQVASYASRLMSRHRLLPLAVLPLVAAACGSAGAGGSSAERVVRGDWEFNHGFTGALAVYHDYESVDEISCAEKPNAKGDVPCTLVVSSSKHEGRPLNARVVVHYDRQGILEGWDLVPPGR
jgi:hypothetical protein